MQPHERIFSHLYFDGIKFEGQEEIDTGFHGSQSCPGANPSLCSKYNQNLSLISTFKFREFWNITVKQLNAVTSLED